MEASLKALPRRKVMTGNAAAAWAVMLCQPNVISAYPITPASEILEVLYGFQADGLLQCEMVEPEGEHSAMSILLGASYGGARTFTATSAQGLFFMFEPYISAANQRLPIVMVNVNREISPPTVVSASGQDICLVKEAGWIQIHVTSCQEIIDTIIMAYRLAEDPEILLPVTVAYDGYYLSYFSEAIDIPPQNMVNEFLPRRQAVHCIDPQEPLTAAPWATGRGLTEYRVKHMAALERTRTKLEEIEAEFEQFFGRSYGGQIEEYRCEDADIILVGMGSLIGTAKVVVDRKREEGLKVGLVNVRLFRPFPWKKLVSALKDRKAIGVIDRDVCFGWQCGHLMMELQAALNKLESRIPMVNFIGGLSGNDITKEHLVRVVDTVKQASEGQPFQEVIFLDLE